jgi:hypothetical protein
MTRTQALLAALVVCAAVATSALVTSAVTEPQADAAPTRPLSASAEPSTVEPDRGRVADQAPIEPLTEVAGNIAGTKLGLLSLRRGGPNVLVATFRVSARRSADDLFLLDFDGKVWWTVSGAELRDEASGRATKPEITNGRCDCSDFHGLEPGESVDLGATFKLDDPEGPFVLRLPGFPEISGIEPAS